MASNPLYELMRSHAVKHNTLILTLPDSVQDRGSLTIGTAPHSSEDSIRIPFGNSTSPGLANSWHIPLDSVSLDGNTKLHLPLISATPNSLFHGASIACNAREKLPDLVLNIGGNDVKLTRDEYSSEQLVYGHPVCVVAILPSEEEGVAVLGTNLLRKYRVVIDMDRGELGCKWCLFRIWRAC
jgi:hypothetical protein